ncbi:hypothetical protein LCGC14_1642100 [marine sediment metagenome]|uniref:Uncharacterized protein n=1 Tax=marine sediment metagenome TaxID=412755 RepID=A0A0F9HZZ1_9ZZZZ|nr:hypothetical protein [bacterium]
MDVALPLIRTKSFNEGLKALIPKRKRSNIIYTLSTFTAGDVRSWGNLKSRSLKVLKKHRFSDFRILVIFCEQCFNNFNADPSCTICNENELQKLIAVDIDHRSKVYNRSKVDMTGEFD